MPTTFSECSSDVTDMANVLMRKYYPDLLDSDVSIAYLFAENKDGVALKLHGYPCAGTVKINSYANRVEGMTDATIKLDKQWWDDHSQDEQLALLDHELCHLLVGTDDEGATITDDLGRPKLKMRMHDWEHGGFIQVAKRHGTAAAEINALIELQKTFVQMELNFGAWG